MTAPAPAPAQAPAAFAPGPSPGPGPAPAPAQLYAFTTLQPSFFIYDNPSTDVAALPAVVPNFGLKEGVEWGDVVQEVRRLNEVGGGVYKLVYVGRHGQGVHNLAEAKYGTEAWDDDWSHRNGDGELVWGPDPLLTSLGEQQAEDVNEEWRLRLHNPNSTPSQKPPLPQRLYSSPFTRALETAKRTYMGVYGSEGKEQLILEGLRETIGGHTCDMRSPKSVIAKRFPAPAFEFEPGFAEGDMLFNSEEELVERLQETLSRIFSPATGTDVASSDGAQVIAISCHSGVMQALFRLTGHRFFTPKTGALVPMVLKAVPATST
ncbi:hypothetical protein A4X03_0g895 [Tilletia caries]|uniref:Phosphoglycerate mutase n=1 Tax=Tilletia caries TaxID=13290 RepID=A0A8T8TS55_9BASI|nr:hypothetical protein A4X03_0g895 [Tilletia caries]